MDGKEPRLSLVLSTNPDNTYDDSHILSLVTKLPMIITLPQYGDECFVITFQLANYACVVFMTIGISSIIRQIELYILRLSMSMRNPLIFFHSFNESFIKDSSSIIFLDRTKMSIAHIGNKIERCIQLCYITDIASKIIAKCTANAMFDLNT